MPLWLMLAMLMGGTAIRGREQTAALSRERDRRRQGREEEKVVEEKQRQEVLGEVYDKKPWTSVQQRLKTG